ncbi:hypothetical protein [Methylobacterium terricola]|uniref:hypothetical protein n=1 Tax=Methylobacterium terricola TaxID=2583531 RepID=UPI001111E550|nr:hypothetical protein [Methylobacterium terricola]
MSAINARKAVQGCKGESQGSGVMLGLGEVATEVSGARAGQNSSKSTKAAQSGSALGLLDARIKGPPGTRSRGHQMIETRKPVTVSRSMTRNAVSSG